VSNMQTKIDAQLRSLGCGFVPEPMARDHIAAGRLVVKSVQRARPEARLGYAWRTPVASNPGAARKPQLGLALRWWLEQLESPATRSALLERHGSRVGARPVPVRGARKRA
jgi:DNA-binding transcriptional LysR family regulator